MRNYNKEKEKKDGRLITIQAFTKVALTILLPLSILVVAGFIYLVIRLEMHYGYEAKLGEAITYVFNAKPLFKNAFWIIGPTLIILGVHIWITRELKRTSNY